MAELTAKGRERTRRWVAMLDADRARLVDEVKADVAQYRALTPEQAVRLREGVVRGAWEMLRARQDRQKVLDHRDPPAPDFERVWQRLVHEGRILRSARADRTWRPS